MYVLNLIYIFEKQKNTLQTIAYNKNKCCSTDLFVFQAMEHLQAFIADCDRRTDAAKKRLAETQEELTAEVAVKANAVHALGKHDLYQCKIDCN